MDWPKSIFDLRSEEEPKQPLKKLLLVDCLGGLLLALVESFAYASLSRPKDGSQWNLVEQALQPGILLLGITVTVLLYGFIRILVQLSTLGSRLDARVHLMLAGGTSRKMQHLAATAYHASVDEAIDAIINASVRRDRSILERWIRLRVESLAKLRVHLVESGALEFHGDEVMTFVRGEYESAKKSVFATWIIKSDSGAFYTEAKWQNAYWRLNLEAIHRKKPLVITRVFIVFRDPSQQEVLFIQRHLEHHQIAVFIVPIEKLETVGEVNFSEARYNDFAIFDDQYVSTWQPGIVGYGDKSDGLSHAIWHIDPSKEDYRKVIALRDRLIHEIRVTKDCCPLQTKADLDAWLVDYRAGRTTP